MTSLDLIADPSRTIPADWEPWLVQADAAAAALRSDVVERDRANKVPHGEFDELRDRGLLTFSLPTEFGGGGQPWALAVQVARRIARVDASIAHILAYHYAWTHTLAILDTPEARRLLTETAEHRWLWASPGSSRLVGPVKLRREGDQIVLDGSFGFATASPLGQRLFIQAVDVATLNFVVASVDPASPGITVGSEWDTLGQRLTASPSVTFDSVRAAASEIVEEFGPVTEPATPFQSIAVLHFQHLLGVLLLGIAEGALEEAAAFTRERSAPWTHSAVTEIGEEPYILSGYGSFLAQVQAASAIVERGGAQLDWLVANKREITAEQRGSVAEVIASGRVVATSVALEVTAGIFDLTGARATASQHGLDRFWRNARTLSLHDPVAYKQNELGRYYLNGQLPTPSGYR